MIQGQTWAMLWTRECPAGACSHQKVGQWKVLPHAFGRTRTVRHSPHDMNSARQSLSEYEWPVGNGVFQLWVKDMSMRFSRLLLLRRQKPWASCVEQAWETLKVEETAPGAFLGCSFCLVFLRPDVREAIDPEIREQT